VLDNLSQPVAFATIPLTSSVEQTSDDQQSKETGSVLRTDSKRESSGEPGTQNTNQSAQAALEDQLALALDDDEGFLSGMSRPLPPLRIYELTLSP